MHRATHRWLPLMVAILSASAVGEAMADDDYRVAFSTYMGGSRWEHGRDIITDAQGNIYVVGGVTSSKEDGFPVTKGAFSETCVGGGMFAGTHDPADVFAAKLSPEGKLLWCTYIGGPNYDRCYSIELDPEGNLILSGRSGPEFPTTKGSLQSEWTGIFENDSLYGAQNAFVCKLSKDGGRLIWSTHLATGALCRGMVVDDIGDVYVAVARFNGKTPAPREPAWLLAALAKAFQKTPGGGTDDLAVVKIKGDGTKVLWATWLSGNGDEKQEACVRVDGKHNVFVAMTTNSTNMPVTGCYDNSANGDYDAYYAKLSPDGSRLIYGTYVGGKGFDQGNETNSLFVDKAGNAYGTVLTNSADFPVTRDKGVYKNGVRGKQNVAAVKLSPEGKLTLAAVIGTSGTEKVEGMTVDSAGCVIFGGFTTAKDFPTTSNAFQPMFGGGLSDAFLVKLSPDFETLAYSTFVGGDGEQFLRGFHVDAAGNIYAIGSSTGDWPTDNAFQDHYAGSNDTRWVNGDVVILKLAPVKKDNYPGRLP